MKLVQTGWWQQGVSEGRLWRETPRTREEGRLNLTSLVPPSLPYRGFPSWPLPSTATATPEEVQEMPLHLQPGPCCPGTQPHPTPHARTETELFCRVTTQRGGRSLLPHLSSGSHPTHPAAQEGHGSLALQGPELAGREKGARVPPRRGIPAPCSAGHPPCRPGLHRGLAPGRTAEHERRRALTGVERHGRAR